MGSASTHQIGEGARALIQHCARAGPRSGGLAVNIGQYSPSKTTFAATPQTK